MTPTEAWVKETGKVIELWRRVMLIDAGGRIDGVCIITPMIQYHFK